MKIFNKRPIFVFALVMMVVAIAVIYHNFFALKVSFVICGAGLFVLGTILYFVLKSKTLKYVFSRVAIIAMAFVVGTGAVQIGANFYLRDYSQFSGNAVVSGRIADVGEITKGNHLPIVVDNVHVEGDGISKDLHGKVMLTILIDGNDQDIFVVGKTIDAYSKISFAKVGYESEHGLTFYFVNKNITASGYALESAVSVVDDNVKLTLSERISQHVERIVSENLDQEYSGLALAMLFGDKSSVDEVVYNDFSGAGIAHLLAVSGLHVGFLVAILLAICKLFKARGYVRFAIVVVVLGFYAYLCGFSVSVLRASIMALCMLFAGCIKEKYDMLNAISLAFVILVCLFPYSITTIGFQLSFSAVLAICLFAKPVSNVLSKFLYKKLAGTIAVLLSVQLGTLAITCMAFEKLTLIAILANFVCLPVASVAYMILFGTIIIATICPPISICVYLFEFVMQVVVKFVHFLAPYGLFEIARWKGQVLSCLVPCSMFVCSEYLLVKKWPKTIVGGVTWLAVLVIILC